MAVKAVVLSYGAQIGLAELLVKRYNALGVGSDLEFLLPENGSDQYVPDFSNVRAVPCQADILSTMKALLGECEDDEWVFWAIDDRYPLDVDVNLFSSLLSMIKTDTLNGINGLKLLPWREQLSDNSISLAGVDFFKQEPVGMFGFWHHQFLRAKVLKDAFISCNVENYNEVRPFNKYYQKQKRLSFLENVYVSSLPIVKLGEPLWDGKLTRNGWLELKKNNCLIPDYEVVDRVLGFYDIDCQIDKDPNFPKKVTLADVGLDDIS